MDGNGGTPFVGDIAVKDGKIAAVGTFTGSGAEEIDAARPVGHARFVDIHTHYDGQAMWDSHLAPSSWHGVTTVVMGNCGVGFAPVRKRHQDAVVALMEGVEDLPGPCLNEGLDWSWESFAEYLTALERRKHDIDFCALLPHAPMRVYVMGERALNLEDANQEDIARMREITAEAVRAGAFGFSTSRTIAHKTLAGDRTPALRAQEAELMGIAMGLKDAGARVHRDDLGLEYPRSRHRVRHGAADHGSVRPAAGVLPDAAARPHRGVEGPAGAVHPSGGRRIADPLCRRRRGRSARCWA